MGWGLCFAVEYTVINTKKLDLQVSITWSKHPNVTDSRQLGRMKKQELLKRPFLRLSPDMTYSNKQPTSIILWALSSGFKIQGSYRSLSLAGKTPNYLQKPHLRN